MQNFDVSDAGTRDKLLNKQLSCQRFENPWRSCDIMAIILHTSSYLTMFSSIFSGMVCCIFPQSHVSHSDISLGQIIYFRSTNFWYLNYLYLVSSIIMAINKFIASLYTTSYHDLSWYNATRLYPVFMMTSSNGNIFRVTGHLCDEFPAQTPVTQSFVAFFDMRLNEWLSKQSCGWWFETPPHPLWRHCNWSGRRQYWTVI